MKDLYVVNCCRTAIGSFGGALKNTPAAEMGAVVVKEALKRANVAPENVDELMFGCILTAAQGQNVARQVSIKAGIPYSVPAYTVGMVCGSGMKSVIEGARSILAGDADIVVCGGTENMSAAPFASMDARWGARMGDKKLVDTMIKDGLWDAYNNYHMGTTADAENSCNGCETEGVFHRQPEQVACKDLFPVVESQIDHLVFQWVPSVKTAEQHSNNRENKEDKKENDECSNNNVAHYDLAFALSRIIQSYISSHI